jgi:hypothetical protein
MSEAESSLPNIVLNKIRAIDNVEKGNNCINIPPTQIFIFYDIVLYNVTVLDLF